ncbi:MAG: hypothetical protein ACE5MM_01900 [Nitrospiraceae bacterium]
MGKASCVRREPRTTQYSLRLVVLGVLVGGCAIPHVPSQVVYEDPTNFVRLELDPLVRPEQPETRHSHPVTISAQVMGEILRGLSVQEHRAAIQKLFAGEAPRQPAFRDEEITILTPQLVEALARASPEERVTFYLSHPQTSIKRLITTGGLYVREDRLHFTLGNHQIVYSIPAYGMVYDRRYPTMPTAPKGFDLHFDPEEVVEKQEVSLWTRLLGREKDEIVINLEKLRIKSPSSSVRLNEMNRPADNSFSSRIGLRPVSKSAVSRLSTPSVSVA